MKVLLVDDEIEFVNTLSNRLGMRGITTEVVYDGEQALEYVSKHEPDVIVLDLVLPKKSGLDLLRYVHDVLPEIESIAVQRDGDVRWLLIQPSAPPRPPAASVPPSPAPRSFCRV